MTVSPQTGGPDLPPIKYLGIGHQSQDIHLGPESERFEAEHGGAAVYTALTAWMLTGERTAVVAATGPNATSGANEETGNLETSVDPEGPQTVFEDLIKGDIRTQRLLSRAPRIDQTLGLIGNRGRNASTVFACPLLDELPFDCRSWFWSDFACLIPQGWFRRVHSDGAIDIQAPDPAQITGPWDLIVLSDHEAQEIEDIDTWLRLTRLLAITRGSEGAVVLDGSEEYQIPALPPPEVADTTGAGDVWAAAFTVRFREIGSIEDAGRFAAAAAAICVSRRGLRGVPESREEVQALLASTSPS